MRPTRFATLTVALLALLGAYLVVAGRPAQAAETLLSQGKPVLASSVESAAFPAAAAVDGDNGTRWASGFADNQWLRVDLGSSQSFNRVVLRWEAAYARGFQLQTSSTATPGPPSTPPRTAPAASRVSLSTATDGTCGC